MKNAPICLYIEKGGKISLTIEGPIRLYFDPRALRRLQRQSQTIDESEGIFDVVRKGVSGLAGLANNPLVKAALSKYIPYGNVAVTAVSAVNSALQLGQKKLAKKPKTTRLVQDMNRGGEAGKAARAAIKGIANLAQGGDVKAIAQLKSIVKVSGILDNMTKLARIGQ